MQHPGEQVKGENRQLGQVTGNCIWKCPIWNVYDSVKIYDWKNDFHKRCLRDAESRQKIRSASQNVCWKVAQGFCLAAAYTSQDT